MALSTKQKAILNALGTYIPALRKGQIGPKDGGDIKLGDLLAATGGGDIKSNGTVAFAAAQSMGSNKLTNVANGTANTDAMAWGQILVFTSTAGAGGAATAAMVLTGLLSTDTILSVSQSVKGANSLPLLGFNTQANNALTAVWSADPGAGAVIKVAVKR